MKHHSLCEKCGERKPRMVHHKHYRTLRQETNEDLLAVCKICHLQIELEKEMAKEKVICEESPYAEAEC